MKAKCNYCEWIGKFVEAVLGYAINAHKEARGIKPSKTKISTGDMGKFHCPECYKSVKPVR